MSEAAKSPDTSGPAGAPRLSTLLLLGLASFGLIAVVALLWPRWSQHAFPQPKPLASAVAAFKVQSAADPVGQHEPPLTEAEVVAVIQAELPALRASQRVKDAFADIVSTRMLPPGAMLSARSQWTLKNGTNYTVWWIQLDVIVGNSFWALSIRENNAPAAKPASEPQLVRKTKVWSSVEN